MGMTDEEVDVFFSCTLCQSYAPNHVCIVSPERLGLCGAYTWIDCKASYEMNPKGANQPIEKGKVIDPERGEWEGINKFVYEKSNRAVQRVHHYSIMSYPETSCCVADTNLLIDKRLTTFGEFFAEVWSTDRYFGKKCLTLDENYRTTEDKIIALQKFKAPKELIRIETKTGLELIVTPDHKVPIDTPDGICWLQAKDLKVGDRLFSLKRINIPAEIPSILELLPDDFRIRSNTLIREVRKFVSGKYGSIKKGELKLGISLHYRKDSISLREIRKLIEDGFPMEKLHTCKYEIGRKNRYYKPTSIKLNKDLFYLLGLIASDGSLTKIGRCEYKITFVNTQPELVKKFLSLTKRLFPGIKIWVSRNKKSLTKIEGRQVRSKKVCYRVQLNDPLFGALAEGFGLGFHKEDHDFKLLFGLPETYIASFIAGLFDGDGSVRIRKYGGKWEYPEIYIPVKGRKVATKLLLLFRRIGIVPYVKKSKSLYKLYIYSENAYRFSCLVQSMHPLKAEKLASIRIKLKNREGLAKCQQNVLPHVVGKELVKIHEGGNQLPATTYFYYSTFKSRPVLANVLKIGQEQLSPLVRKFISCDVMLDIIKVIEKIPGNRFDYVYNLTLSDIHSYFANGIWIANCGCFECIVGVIPEANGVMIVNREYQGQTPLGMTFSTLAGSVGGGNQVPGFLGIGKLFITSRKFIRADGGIKRIVWMPKALKEEIKERFVKRTEEEGVPDLLDKIADETVAQTLEELLVYLEKVKHPALEMPPILEV
jgi:intein/homing endonuclease